MSNTGDQGTGGASIIPTARRSIHSHPGCPFALAEAMGRYGIENKQAKRAQTIEYGANQSNDRGTDEVDNVLSKPSRIINPSSFTQKNQFDRRNSLNRYEQLTDDDNNILSKSLPATLPSHSYCSDSDSSYNSASYGTPLANRNTPVVNKLVNLNRSGSVSTPHKQNSSSTAQENEAQGSSRLILSLLMILVGVLATVISMLNITDISKNVVYDESRFYNDIDLLGNKYNIDENAVLRMQTGIATIFKRQDTGSFIFVYNSNDNHFNPKEFDTFINDVSDTASKYLRNESTPVHYTMVEGSTLQMKGHGELISRFRKELDRTGVMLVKHVEAIPSTLAMAFHYYCDEYNPLVKKSAIFFTLNLAECSESKDNQSGKKSTHAVIEKCLAQKWNGVPADSIGPLLTRVVSVLIDVTSAF